MTLTLPSPKHGLIGHRGLAGYAPENTLSSLQAAYEYGLNWAEIDVQLSKDNQLIIFHDHFLERTSNGKGEISQLNYSDIVKYDAGSWYDKRFQNEKILNLDKNLQDLLQFDLHYNIELKCPNHATEYYIHQLCHQFCQLITKKWPIQRPLPLISSFNWELILKIRSHLKDIPIGFLCESITPEVVRLAVQHDNSTINCDHRGINKEDIVRALHLDIPLLAYTVNEPAVASHLINQGVFAVYTDMLVASTFKMPKAG